MLRVDAGRRLSEKCDALSQEHEACQRELAAIRKEIAPSMKGPIPPYHLNGPELDVAPKPRRGRTSPKTK